MGADGPELSCPGSSVVAEGARFENLDASETIDLDLLLSFRPQLPTEESILLMFLGLSLFFLALQVL
jgi:hypothetical protein